MRITARRPSEKLINIAEFKKLSWLKKLDTITFSLPCTDMNVKVKSAGLDGKQPKLFYQAIRIIKEMRFKTGGKYPRWIVLENVL